ncbi:MAG: transcription antitermination factor NusB [Pseudomonadota bacterium]
MNERSRDFPRRAPPPGIGAKPYGRDRKPKDGPARDKKTDRPPVALPGMASRQAALDILNLVRNGAALDEALDRCRSFDALEGADRKFARALATTVLRRQGALDHVIGAYLNRPLPKRAARVGDILRLAAAQSLFFETPDHAAVSLATEIAKRYEETKGYEGLINAIARKIAKAGPDAVASLPPRVDTPGWLWRAWERAYGPQKTRAIAAAHENPAPLDLTPQDASKLEALGDDLGAEIVLGASLRLRVPGPLTELAGFAEGAWWVQDAAAAVPARLLGDIAGKTVFDLCAAPGGKTMQLAAARSRVIAVDQSGPRLKRVQENLERVGLRAETVKEDVLAWEPARLADAILLDAPCSATGTIRRHPDILRSKTEDDVRALVALQAAMIDKAVALLRPGGTLVYATCSLQSEEGERQASAALSRHETLSRLPVQAGEVGGLDEAITRDGDLRFLPSMLADQGGIDGFFAARFVKAAT